MVTNVPGWTGNMSLIFVTGPTRSGKSKWAEQLVSESSDVIYIATSIPNLNDKEWTERIHKHQQRRPKSWNLIEASDLNNTMMSLTKRNSTILIDSLGGYITKFIDMNDSEWDYKQNEFLKLIQSFDSKIILVAEEVGWGIVSHTKIGNIFRDRQGYLMHKLSFLSEQYWLVINGRAIDINAIGIKVS